MSATSLPNNGISVNPLDLVLHRLEAHNGQPAKRSGDGYTTRCPAHEDTHASLSVTEADDGRVLIYCHAGCTVQAIMQALGLPMSDLFPRREPERKRKPTPEPKPAPVPTYIYVNADGEPVHATIRQPGKRFAQARPNPDAPSGWVFGLAGLQPVLYRLPEVMQAVADGRTIYVCEGEKDADNLCALGLTATTNPMGACKWRKQYTECLRGADVVVLPDHDEPGEAHGQQVATALHGVADRVRVLHLPDLPAGGDVSDWLDRGGTIEDLQALVDECEAYTPPATTATVTTDAAALTDEVLSALRDPTDSGNAALLVALHGHDLRFDHQRQRWLVWQGHWWADDGDGEVLRRAHDAARFRYKMIWDIFAAEEGLKGAVKAALKAKEHYKLTAALAIAKVLRPVADASPWDVHPHLLGVENGVIDLRSGDLSAGDRDQRITQHIPVSFDPAAECPRWERFIQEIADDRDDLAEYMRLAIGYSFTAETREQCLFVAHGRGATGKSTLTAALLSLAGPYGRAASFEAFADPPGHLESLAVLAGRRIVTAGETRENTGLNEQRLKSLSHGNDTLAAAFKHGHEFTFTPVCKLWLCLNHKPRVNDDSTGFWRSVRLLPFDRVFDPAAEPDLADTLAAERAGILTWVVRAARDWYAHGLQAVASVQTATAAWERQENPLLDWVEAALVLGDDCETATGDLWSSYCRWAESENLSDKERLTRRSFANRLTLRFGESTPVRRNGKLVRVYKGVGIEA